MGVRQESAMAVLSSLIRTAANLAPRRLLHSTKARAGGYSVQQRPSRWEWDRLKDDIHLPYADRGPDPRLDHLHEPRARQLRAQGHPRGLRPQGGGVLR